MTRQPPAGCPVCRDNAARRATAEADLAEALVVLATIADGFGVMPIDGGVALVASMARGRSVLDRHRAPETRRRGEGAS